MEAAFSGEADLRIRTDGALFTGPPRFNPLFVRVHATVAIRAARRSSPSTATGGPCGSSAASSDGIEPTDRAVGGTRVLYVQHPSDPIVWWGSRPAAGPDRTGCASRAGTTCPTRMRWFPLVTFWQVTIDMPFAVGSPTVTGTATPAGSVDAWATMLQPEADGWTRRRTDRSGSIANDPMSELTPIPVAATAAIPADLTVAVSLSEEHLTTPDAAPRAGDRRGQRARGGGR
jgi:uncharacterized membrane protein